MTSDSEPSVTTAAEEATSPGRRRIAVASTGVAAVTFVLLLAHMAATGRLFPPPLNPDGIAYDSIGVAISEGHGFAPHEMATPMES